MRSYSPANFRGGIKSSDITTRQRKNQSQSITGAKDTALTATLYSSVCTSISQSTVQTHTFLAETKLHTRSWAERVTPGEGLLLMEGALVGAKPTSLEPETELTPTFWG